jgi:hypothetical protein
MSDDTHIDDFDDSAQPQGVPLQLIRIQLPPGILTDAAWDAFTTAVPAEVQRQQAD